MRKNNEKNDKRLLFKTACNSLTFDRKLRCLERNFKCNEMTQIELLQFRNPKQFWDEIKNSALGNILKYIWKYIELVINNMIYSIKKVLYKGEQEFMSLYNVIPPSDSEECIQIIKQYNYLSELNMKYPLYSSYCDLDHEISFAEIKRAVNIAKCGKSPGNDNISNEILKYDILLPTLCKIFNVCFDSGILPSAWSKAIIILILKSKESDPRTHLNFLLGDQLLVLYLQTIWIYS